MTCEALLQEFDEALRFRRQQPRLGMAWTEIGEACHFGSTRRSRLSNRVGIKLSPEMNYNDISDATPQETYIHLVEQLRAFDLAYLHAMFGASINYHALLRLRFTGSYMIGGNLDQLAAESVLLHGHADATVWCR
jgi:hypothetical protein